MLLLNLWLIEYWNCDEHVNKTNGHCNQREDCHIHDKIKLWYSEYIFKNISKKKKTHCIGESSTITSVTSI